jgi:uncharacterized protein (DUF302 family)
MSFYYNKVVHYGFEDAIAKVTEALKSEGFGVLTTIDIASKLKEKIGVEFRKYVILGACNPMLAHKALLIEDKIGVMLPCNIIVQQTSENETEIAAINPQETMQAIGNEKLLPIAKEVSEKLKRVLDRIA